MKFLKKHTIRFMCNNQGFSIAALIPLILLLVTVLGTTLLPGVVEQLQDLINRHPSPIHTSIALPSVTGLPTNPLTFITTPGISVPLVTLTPLPTEPGVSVPIATPTAHTPPPPAGGVIVNECDGALSGAVTKMETQAWWVDSANDGNPTDDFGHIHATMCFPLLGQIPSNQLSGGKWRTNVRVVLHHNPSEWYVLRFDNQSGGNVAKYEFNPPRTCGIHETCVWDVPVELDISKFSGSALRVRATTRTPDGKRFTTSSDWMLASGNVNSPIQGKSWYASPVDDYAIAQLDPRTAPRGPVSGTHVFKVKTKKASKQLEVILDRTHGAPGVGMWRAEPANAGQVVTVFNEDVKDWRDIPIDTTQLSDGWHTLFIGSTNPKGEASRCSTCDNDVDFLHGALKIWFYTQNGNEGPPITPPISDPAPSFTIPVTPTISVSVPTHSSTPTPGTTGVSRAPTPTVLTVPTPTPTTAPPVTLPPVTATTGIWTSAQELAGKPTSGAAWDALVADARKATASGATVANQDSDNNVQVLAAAIVYARGQDSVCSGGCRAVVIGALEKLVATGKPSDRTLAWARETGSYVMAADLVGYRTPAFESWVRNMAEVWVASDGRTLLAMFEQRPNNWGTMAFGSLTAMYRYLGDRTKLDYVYNYWRQQVEGPVPSKVKWGDLCWQADRSNPRIINRPGSSIGSVNVDGVVPDDQRRSGCTINDPGAPGGYPSGHLNGTIVGARVLARAGYPVWSVGNQAIRRAVHKYQEDWAGKNSGWTFDSGKAWVLPIVDEAYGTNFSARSGSAIHAAGKNGTGSSYIVR